MNKPKKCSDDTCKQVFEKCPVNVVCPLFKPYLCADLECVGEPSQCSVIPQCPSSKPYRCPDLSCGKDQGDCLKETICPPTNAIRCPRGECVDDIDECKNSLFIEKCTDESKPFLCSNQECVSSPGLCVGKNNNGNSRILAENSSIIDPGCDNTNPKLCSDGSCRTSYSDCELINGCFEPGFSYRCLSGQCAASKEECVDDQKLANCSESTHRCEDGICRAQCPDFNGCPLENPIQCSNGFCVNDISKCLVNEDNGKAICVDNSAGDCLRPIRSYPAEKMTVTVSKYMSLAINFISNEKTNSKYASLVIPAGALNELNKNMNSSDYPYDILYIRPVAFSTLKETTNSFVNEKIMKYLFQGATHLSPEQFLRSAVFSLQVNENNDTYYSKALNLTITIDPIEGLSTNSYCLGSLVPSTNQWSCVDENVTELNERNQLSFSLSKNGIYSVILALRTQSFIQGGIKENTYCDWWCENGGAVIGAIVGVLIGGLVFGIFFFGFTKYAKKQNQEGINEELIDGQQKENAKEQGKKKIEEAMMNLQQKNKILEETNNERTMAFEQNESLVKQLENLKMELQAIKN
jgi:hypothetical protein